YVLRDGIGRYDVEGDVEHGSERAESHHGAREVVIPSAKPPDLTGCAEQRESAHGGGEGADSVAGAVRSGRDGAGDGDVRQRGQIVQGEPLRLERGRDVAVAQRTADAYRIPLLADLDDGRHPIQCDVGADGVGDVVEA